MLSTEASGAGTTDSFAFRVVTDTTYSYQNDQLVNQSFPFRSYISGAKVVINVLGLQDGVTYFFLVYAINVYGVSNSISITVLPTGEFEEFTRASILFMGNLGKH